MDRLDWALTITTGLVLSVGGVVGGINSWARETDSLPLLVWGGILPAISVWLGRRLAKASQAIGIAALLGALFVVSSLPFYQNSENIVALIISVLISALVAGIASVHAGPRSHLPEDAEELRAIASETRNWAIIGVIIVGQLLQPALLERALRLEAIGRQREDSQVQSHARTARIIASLWLLAMFILVLWVVVAASLATIGRL